MTDIQASAEGYAQDILDGKIPASELVKKTCERFFSFIERDDVEYRPQEGVRAVRFIQALPHVKGRWASKRESLKLQPWQMFIVVALFSFYKNGLRMHTEAYIEIPRKNGKSTLAAAIALYIFLESREHGAEVYSGATTEAQAWEVFRPMRDMVKGCSALAEHYDVTVYGKSMYVPSTGARAQPLVGKPGDGASPSLAVCDEYHEHATDDLYDTMRTGMGARGGDPDGDEPMMLAITTAGDNLDGPCFERRQDMIAVLNGEVDQDSCFALIYSIDEEDEWDNMDSLRKANPNFGISVSETFLEAQLAQARRSARKQGSFVTKHLNRWVGSTVGYMNMLEWGKRLTQDRPVDMSKAWIGIDLASKRDITAVVALVELGQGKYFIEPHFFCPEETDIERWHQHAIEGDLQLTPGGMTDYAFVEELVMDLCSKYNVQEIGFDEWQSQYLAVRLQGRGANMIAFPHQVKTFSDPMKEIEGMVYDGKLLHSGNKLMTAMVGNVVTKEDAKENIYPTKARPGDVRCKIDGFVALVMAAGLMLRARENGSMGSYFSNPVGTMKIG